MKKALLAFTLTLLFFNSYSREPKIKFDPRIRFIGEMKYLSPPIYYGQKSNTNKIPISFDVDKSVSGLRIGLGVQVDLLNANIAFRFLSDLSYGHLYYSQPNSPSQPSYIISTNSNITGLTFDNQIKILKSMKLRKLNFQLGLGYSWLNKGSEYSMITKMPNSPSNHSIVYQYDLKFDGFIYSLAFPFNENEIGLDLYQVISINHNYGNTKSMLIPSLRFLYKFKLTNHNEII